MEFKSVRSLDLQQYIQWKILNLLITEHGSKVKKI
jgi:hypothetical protein